MLGVQSYDVGLGGLLSERLLRCWHRQRLRQAHETRDHADYERANQMGDVLNMFDTARTINRASRAMGCGR